MTTHRLHDSRNGAAYHLGGPDQWAGFALDHPRLGPMQGKAFLRPHLNLTGMEVSLNSLAAGQGIPYLHAHRQNEECYLFLGGQGEFQLDGLQFGVCAGSAVRVDPAGMRGIRNIGSEPLLYLVIQAKAGSLEQANTADGILGEHPPVWSAPEGAIGR